jgi:hypothetical protein
LELNLEGTEAAVERQELRKHLVVRRRRWAKKRIQDNVGSWQKVYTARKRMIHCAVPAVCKARVRKGSRKVSDAKRATLDSPVISDSCMTTKNGRP